MELFRKFIRFGNFTRPFVSSYSSFSQYWDYFCVQKQKQRHHVVDLLNLPLLQFSFVFSPPLATQGSETKHFGFTLAISIRKKSFNTQHVFFPLFQQHSQRYIRKCPPCIGRLSHHLEMFNSSVWLQITALPQVYS